MMALKRIVEEKDVLRDNMKWLYLSLAMTAGVAAVMAVTGGMGFDFVSSAERQALSQFPPEDLNPLLADITNVRQMIFTADCWRTVVIIVIGTLLLLFYKAGKLKPLYMLGGIFVLCLVDMWQVDKRYLNDGMFVPRSERDTPPEMSETDRMILEDKSLDYRVLNFSTNTFNENETSYFHKSVGGYHPAKLRRYQELIEAYISPEMRKAMEAIAKNGGDMAAVDGNAVYPVLNMLNTKYFIMPLQGGDTAPIENPYACGNAWFVNKVSFVDNANEELATVGKIDVRHEAVADKKFQQTLGASTTNDSTATVTLKSYEPDRLVYDVKSTNGGVLVFSEIYYPGWTATIDGNDVPVGRVNYVLRALNMKPGNHKVELTFKPKTVVMTERIANTASAILVIILVAVTIAAYRKRRTTQQQ